MEVVIYYKPDNQNDYKKVVDAFKKKDSTFFLFYTDSQGQENKEKIEIKKSEFNGFLNTNSLTFQVTGQFYQKYCQSDLTSRSIQIERKGKSRLVIEHSGSVDNEFQSIVLGKIEVRLDLKCLFKENAETIKKALEEKSNIYFAFYECEKSETPAIKVLISPKKTSYYVKSIEILLSIEAKWNEFLKFDNKTGKLFYIIIEKNDQSSKFFLTSLSDSLTRTKGKNALEITYHVNLIEGPIEENSVKIRRGLSFLKKNKKTKTKMKNKPTLFPAREYLEGVDEEKKSHKGCLIL